MKIILFISFIFLILPYSFALANPIPINEINLTFSNLLFEGLPILFSGLLFGTAVEIICGYLLFFRKQKKGIWAILIANIISFPLFYLYLTATHSYLSFTVRYMMMHVTWFLYLVFGEVAVIFIEMFIIKLVLKNEITYRKSFLISLVLNIISVILGIAIQILIPIEIIFKL